MEVDRISHHSDCSSVNEFVVVNAEPKLSIAENGDMCDLEQKLSEVLLSDEHSAVQQGQQQNVAAAESVPESSGESAAIAESEFSANNMSAIKSEGVFADNGKEHFSSVNGDASQKAKSEPVNSNLEFGKDSQGRDVISNDDAVIFTGVTYLGSAAVNAPRSEVEITRNIAILNSHTQLAIPITLSVPVTSDGTVYMIDPATNTTVASYNIHRILFCARGLPDKKEKQCFAFTSSHGTSSETTIFQCHVFRCSAEEPAQVTQIIYSFASAFRCLPPPLVNPAAQDSTGGYHGDENVFKFNVSLEFKEDDGRGNFVTCPKDKNVFKLRCDVEKKIVLSVQQLSHDRQLKIERCFGLLISPGRNVKHSDMHLIDMVSMGVGADGRSYMIAGFWDPSDPTFHILNTETPKDTRVFLTVAVDLVMEGIQEPVRFLLESKAKIYPLNERFWYFTKKPYNELFTMKLKQCEKPDGNKVSGQFEVISLESQSEIERLKTVRNLTLSPGKMVVPQQGTSQDPDNDESDNDEPLLSGSGIVSKDVTDETLLDSWHKALTIWHQNLKVRPKQVQLLVYAGIPEALRGEVWQLLTGCIDNTEMLESYRILITKESPCEQVISRDINRTFPAHDYFREAGGIGQDALFKISKAYSVYDEEVGYCQGLSFLAAALLLHMPEEEAFCVLVKIMFAYGIRDLFKQGFEELHIKFYQLERLMQEQLPDLFEHFMELGLEAHMYASQWFLTLFTAKFPLFMVFHIMDLFLSDGINTIFRVALSLLKTSRKDLLALDFEGVLKYFRVSLPKKYRSEEIAKELLQLAVAIKVTPKKLKKFEKEYLTLKEAQLQQEDPVERFQRENKRLIETNLRLERENDDLAHELVNSKIALRNDLDHVEDKCELLNKELLQTRKMLLETEEEKKRLENEATQLKEMCRRELDRTETENRRNRAIIADYKQICSQLSERLEKQQAASKEELQQIKAQIRCCENCSQLLDSNGYFRKSGADTAPATDKDPALLDRDLVIRELELELAQTKLALVESECKTQDLTHHLNAAVNEIQESKSTWFQKTLSSIKEVTRKDNNAPAQGGNKKEREKEKEGKENVLTRKDSKDV